MLNIGEYNTLVVARNTDHGIYLKDSEGEEVLLPNKFVTEEMVEGVSLDVFVYTDSMDRPVATTRKPLAVVGEFAALYVKDVTKFGAFLDWGLEKDLFVPWREQSEEMVEGRMYVVRICLDHRSGRVIGVSKIHSFIDSDTSELESGQEVDLMVYKRTEMGYLVLVNQRYSGLVYHSDVYGTPWIGERRKGFVKRVREDGKLDISFGKKGYDQVEDSKDVIVDALIKAGGKLPYHDKTDAETIRKVFKMSKKNFKKVIGSLYKAGLVELSDKGIKLVV
ncbi:GntR family transcriptional regulator [Fulvitalea axinellae]|uniref:GntR family transcriptional regulator n=1 Tax=Fulvitalea axinellae TaxID=1182444 RepID=A0AAU9CND1_9BACT|nr:GntR family transcriptional regulator [Fulvitalea axinellae]